MHGVPRAKKRPPRKRWVRRIWQPNSANLQSAVRSSADTASANPVFSRFRIRGSRLGNPSGFLSVFLLLFGLVLFALLIPARAEIQRPSLRREVSHLNLIRDSSPSAEHSYVTVAFAVHCSTSAQASSQQCQPATGSLWRSCSNNSSRPSI
jgi:hypothetical protein